MGRKRTPLKVEDEERVFLGPMSSVKCLLRSNIIPVAFHKNEPHRIKVSLSLK